MPATSNSKSKTTGMRILWIPGGRKSHPKGRFDATNKRITYTGGQKKSQVWSLGGNRTQADLLRAEPDTSLLDGPSVSRLAPVTYLSAGSAAVAVASTSSAAATAAAIAEQANENKSQTSESPTNIPCTPNSTTSTAPLVSLPHSPQPDSSLDESADEMPTQTTTKPVIITTTTTAEIILDENRFSLLGKDLSNDEDNLLDLPSVPKELNNGGGEEQKQSETLTLNNSSGTNASTADTTPLTTSPKSDDGIYATPTRKKHYRHHNNHQQEDVNSIESIADNNTSAKVKVPNEDLTFLNEIEASPNSNVNGTEKNPNRNGNVMINLNGSVKLKNEDDELDQNTKRIKKKKNKLGKTKELDQLDGVVAIQKTATKTNIYNNNNNNSAERKQKKGAIEKEEPEDEKFVQCLYYTLMCCDCTIS